MDLSKLRFLSSHEWALIEDGICTVGITQFAVEQLTDVTNLDLPKTGQKVQAGKPFGEIESVKAVFDLNAPVSGEIIAINQAVAANPSLVTADPYVSGWMIKIKMTDPSRTSHLLDLTSYEKQLSEQGH